MTQTNKLRPTAEQVRELLSYDPDTGIFRWRRGRGGIAAGSVAGYLREGAYLWISIFDHQYCAHRLAWLYTYGEWPAAHVDHVNGVRVDNRIANLREASMAENNRNRCLGRDNTSGAKGVTWHRASKKWRARIQLNGNGRSLGLFSTIADAAAAYDQAAIDLHGEFARTNADGLR